MRRPRALPVALLVLGTLLGSSAVALPASAAQTQGLAYVALGDSYAAGFGITPSIASPPAPATGCLQAEQNYPHQVAAALGLTLTDATCTGAVTDNIYLTPQVTDTDFGGGTAPLQAGALSAATRVVTVSIGGNDAGFSEIAEDCLAQTAAGPTIFTNSASCQAYYQANPSVNPENLIPTTVATNLAAAYAAIRLAAPNAQVFVVGYPSLLPDAANTPAGGCFTPLFQNGTSGPPTVNALPFTDVDVPFIHSLEVLLNQTIRTAAANAGFTFIDNQPASLAHSACPQTTTAPTATPYVNGVTLNVVNPPPVTENGGLHPNVAGVAFLAAQTTAAIAAAFPDPAPATVPVVPVLAVTGADAGPTIALVVASVLMIGAGILTMLRSRRRARPVTGRETRAPR